MTLLEQLRDIRRHPQGLAYKPLHELCEEAAEEIERLQGIIDKAFANLDVALSQPVDGET